MPKTGTPLSATAVRNLREPGKYYDLHGLFLPIGPTGSRRWVQRVSVAGRQREIGLGSADLVTLAEARELAVSNEDSAQTSLHVLLSDQAPNHNGAYFSQSSILYKDKGTKDGGWPMVSPNPNARDIVMARKLTAKVKEQLGLTD